MARLIEDAPKKVAPPTPPAAPQPAIDPYVLAQALANAMRQVRIPEPQVTVDVAAPNVVVSPPETEARPTKWVFKIERNKDGFISGITATAG